MPPPSSPHSQAHSQAHSTASVTHADSTFMMTDTAEGQTPAVPHGSQKAHHGTVLKDCIQQAAGKHALVHLQASQEDDRSSQADMCDTNTSHQGDACNKAGTSSKVAQKEKYPRPSSWQRKKAAKLRQAQQELQPGRCSSLLARLQCVFGFLTCSKTTSLSWVC